MASNSAIMAFFAETEPEQPRIPWTEAIELYSEGYTLNDLGEMYGVTRAKMFYGFKQRKIAIRSSIESNRLKRARLNGIKARPICRICTICLDTLTVVRETDDGPLCDECWHKENGLKWDYNEHPDYFK